MSNNYKYVDVSQEWADSRETHIAVATAIHAIADDKRPAQAIWEAPTPAEWDHVKMAIVEFISRGYFLPVEDGRYPWGAETVELVAE